MLKSSKEKGRLYGSSDDREEYSHHDNPVEHIGTDQRFRHLRYVAHLDDTLGECDFMVWKADCQRARLQREVKTECRCELLTVGIRPPRI
ncbi:hypothetical protein KCU67_g86, partial [Aureobasidium melanogenum]